MARRKIEGSRAIVTGASSGIGREIALELARHGARLILTARRQDRLKELVDQVRPLGGQAQFVVGDITDADIRRAVVEAAQSFYGGLDVLVNNAGIGAVGEFRTATPDRLRRVMEVNFFAPAELIRQALPLLQLGKRPIVVNVSSVLGHRAVPGKSEYCASKFALHGLSDALRAELAAVGIDVLLVSPSTTESEFFDALIATPAPSSPRRRAMPARLVAKRTLRAIRRGRHEIILTPSGTLLVWLDRLAPALAERLVARFG